MVFPEPEPKSSSNVEKLLPMPDEFPYDCLECGRKFATAIALSIVSKYQFSVKLTYKQHLI
jgi:hypothetical protein